MVSAWANTHKIKKKIFFQSVSHNSPSQFQLAGRASLKAAIKEHLQDLKVSKDLLHGTQNVHHDMKVKVNQKADKLD